MIERPKFKEGNASFAAALNEVVDFAARTGVNPTGLPGWEEGVNGWRPPIVDSESGTTRQFAVRRVGSDTIRVTPGKVHYDRTEAGETADANAGWWIAPTWDGADDFNADITISATTTLGLKIETNAEDHEITAVTIGFDLTITKDRPETEVSLQIQTSTGTTVTGSGTVTTTSQTPVGLNPTFQNGEVWLPLATINFSDDAITGIDQYIDGGILLVPDVAYSFVSAL